MVQKNDTSRRNFANVGITSIFFAAGMALPSCDGAYAIATIDVNNAVAREFTAFPG